MAPAGEIGLLASNSIDRAGTALVAPLDYYYFMVDMAGFASLVAGCGWSLVQN
jgi:hypothetical protein